MSKYERKPKLRKTPKGIMMRMGTSNVKGSERTVDVFFSKIKTRDDRIVYPCKLSFLVYDEPSKKFSREWGNTEWYQPHDIERLIKLLQDLAVMKVEAKPKSL